MIFRHTTGTGIGSARATETKEKRTEALGPGSEMCALAFFLVVAIDQIFPRFGSSVGTNGTKVRIIMGKYIRLFHIYPCIRFLKPFRPAPDSLQPSGGGRRRAETYNQVRLDPVGKPPGSG